MLSPIQEEDRAPLVSVLTCVYNTERFIGEAIDSILSQSYRHIEYVILDDGSTDSTADILRTYASRDSRIKLIRHETCQGIVRSRNELLEKANGKYIAWQDGDDRSMHDRITKQVEYMESHPGVGICGGWLRFISGTHTSVRKYAPDDTSLRRSIFRYSPVAQPGAIVRRSVLKRIGGFNSRYSVSEDLDLSFRIGTCSAFANLQEIVIEYRETSGSSTYTKLREMEANSLQIRNTFAHHPAYHFRWWDALYLAVQRCSLSIIPARLKIRLFNALRNSTS